MGGERHCEGSMSCPRTQWPFQGLTLNLWSQVQGTDHKANGSLTKKKNFWNKECCSLLLSSAFWVSCSSEELFPFALSPTVNNWRWLVKVLSNAVLLVLVLIDEKSVHHRLPSHSHPPTPQVFFQIALYLLKYYLHCTCQEIICFKC